MSAQQNAASMSEEEIEACRQVFSIVDEDGSGSIGADELQHLLKLLRLPHKPAEVLAMIEEIDQDGNGEVDFDEFLLVSPAGLVRTCGVMATCHQQKFSQPGN